MPSKPHSTLLDREEATRLVNQHFSKQCALLADLANYGSNLILRAFNSGPKQLGDTIVCGVLLKQAVGMIDAVEALISSGSVQAAHLPARSAFEASLYIEFMLFSDLEVKANHYYVANLRAERKWALRGMPGTKEFESFSSIMGKLGDGIIDDHLSDHAERHLDEVNKILSQSGFTEIDKSFDKLRGNGKADPEWYKFFNIKSIRDLAKHLHRLPEYEMLYSTSSNIAHSSLYKDQIAFDKGKVNFKTIRNLEKLPFLLVLTVAQVFKLYQVILQHYRPTELPNFGAKYSNDWAEPFRELYSLKLR